MVLAGRSDSLAILLRKVRASTGRGGTLALAPAGTLGSGSPSSSLCRRTPTMTSRFERWPAPVGRAGDWTRVKPLARSEGARGSMFHFPVTARGLPSWKTPRTSIVCNDAGGKTRRRERFVQPLEMPAAHFYDEILAPERKKHSRRRTCHRWVRGIAFSPDP